MAARCYATAPVPKGIPLMRKTRLLLTLCALAFALAVALAKPLTSRADSGDPQTSPLDPTPTNADPIIPQLPVVSLKPLRRPASVLHRALHVPLGSKVVKYAKHFLGVRYVYGGTSPGGRESSCGCRKRPSGTSGPSDSANGRRRASGRCRAGTP